MRRIFYLICLLITINLPNFAQADGSKQVIAKIDAYLQALQNIESEFIQTDSKGLQKRGMLFIRKPNKIRIEYIQPEKELLMLSADLIMHYNPELDETNYVNGEAMAIDLLAKKKFSLMKEAKILSFDVSENMYEVQFQMKNDKSKRIITVKFFKDPLELFYIGVNTGQDFVAVNMLSPVINGEISKSKFEFSNREFSSLSED